MIDHIRQHRDKALIFSLIGLCCLINFRNIFLPLYDGDSSLYAEVAREVFRNWDFLHLTQQGQPFLDKPHMFFWLSGLSLSVFGVNAFAFKLPSFLALLVIALSVYKLTKQYYTEAIASYATLIAVSSLGVFFMTNDVRMEMLLTCFIIAGMWAFSSYLLYKKVYALVLAAFCFAAAYYTKGAIGVIIPAVAIVPHMLKFYPRMFTLKILILLFAVFLFFLTPLLGLAYLQFGWAGVQYFLWSHIADRFTGKSISNNPDTFFVWHTTLWVVAPWTLFLLAGIWKQIAALIKPQADNKPVEIFCLSGLFFSLLAMSFSSFQQSYFVYPLIPFVAILAAAYSQSLWNKKPFSRFQLVVNMVAPLLAAILIFYVTPGNFFYITVFALLALAFIYVSRSAGIIASTGMAAVVLNFVLSFIFFPAILKYQPNYELSRFAKSKNLSEENFVSLYVRTPPQYVFYSEIMAEEYLDYNELLAQKKPSPYYVFTDQRGYDDMRNAGVSVTFEKQLNNFHLTKLNLKFLNPETREASCEKWFVLKVEQH